MKAIYKGKIYHLMEVRGNDVELGFFVEYSDPNLIIDPTDDEINYAEYPTEESK